MSMPPMKYADNNGVFIAYRTVGEGDDVVIAPAATLTMEVMWSWVQRVAETSRVTWSDKRGTGASDGAGKLLVRGTSRRHQSRDGCRRYRASSRWVDRVVASSAGDRDAMTWFWDMWAPTLSATPGFFDLVDALPRTTSPLARRA